jgi:Tol biopolymer transport system component
MYGSRTPQRIDVYVAPFDMASFAVTGQAKRVNEPADLANSSPAWSPDGTRLAWKSPDDLGSNGLDTTVVISQPEQRTTTVVPAQFMSGSLYMSLQWSADGRFVLGSGFRNGRSSIHRIDVSTGAADVLLPEDSSALAPGKGGAALLGFSPDGLIYKVVPDRLAPVGIVEHRLSDGREREISKGVGWKYVGDVRLSPDGSWLVARTAVVRNPARGSVYRLEVFPTAGGAGRVMAGTEGMRVGLYNWAPDSRSILFTTFPETTPGAPPVNVWQCSIDGDAPKKIGLSMQLLQEAVLSPDGKRIAFTGGTRPTDEGVWLMENFLPPSKPAKK